MKSERTYASGNELHIGDIITSNSGLDLYLSLPALVTRLIDPDPTATWPANSLCIQFMDSQGYLQVRWLGTSSIRAEGVLRREK